MDPNTDTVRSISDLVKKDSSTLGENHDHDGVIVPVENGNSDPKGFTNPNYENLNANHNHLNPTDIIIDEKEPDVQSDTADTTENTATEPVTLSKWRKPRELKLKFFVFLMFITIVTGVAVIIKSKLNKELNIIELGTSKFNVKERNLIVLNGQGRHILEGKIGQNISDLGLPYNCSSLKSTSIEWCLEWHDTSDKEKDQKNTIRAKLQVVYSKNDTTDCYDVTWETFRSNVLLTDCYDITTSHWYGGSLGKQHRWPLGNITFSKQPFLSSTPQRNFGPVLESYWLSSDGSAIFVKNDHPLHVSFNAPNGSESDGQICLNSDYNEGPYKNKNPDSAFPFLNYTICVDKNMKKVHEYVVSQSFSYREPPVDLTIFKEPVWSTRTLSQNFSQTTIEELGRKINVSNPCEKCLLVIDGPWEKAYGDLEFDSSKFSNYVTMTTYLKSLGFQVALSISPFISTNSKNFKDFLDKDYLVKGSDNEAPGLKKVWDGPKQDDFFRGVAGVIDFYDRPSDWFSEKLNNLSGNFDSFRFLRGDVDSLPADSNFVNESLGPFEYTRKYIDLVSKVKDNVQVQCGTRTQQHSVLIQIYDKNSTWEASTNGLQSVIPDVLTLGILGYPFIIPDVIGGNGFYGKPSPELYIRWAQLSAFLPTMQFSILPDEMENPDVKKIVTDMIKTHKEEVYPIIEKLLKDDSQPLQPIIRPLWWIEPNTAKAKTINDEFLVGNDLLVAPIVNAGQTERDVYLPIGKWKRKFFNEDEIDGPTTVENESIPLDTVAYYKKIG